VRGERRRANRPDAGQAGQDLAGGVGEQLLELTVDERDVSVSGVDHEGERERTTDEVSKAYRRHPKPGSSHCPGSSLAGAC
jgi:hypothetical protein